MQTPYLDPDYDPAVDNVKPLAAAMLAKCQRLIQPGPLLYETYIMSQDIKAKSAAKALTLNLTPTPQAHPLESPIDFRALIIMFIFTKICIHKLC